MLNYFLQDNPLTPRTDDMAARTVPGKTYDRASFIDLMLQRGTLVTKTDIVAVFNNMEETAAYIVESGDTFSLPLCNVSFSIAGVFEGATDVFDPERHRLNVNVNKGTVLRNAEKRVKLAKTTISSSQHQIIEARDSVTGSVDTTLTSGGAVEIAGINIKLSGDKPEVGLYFVAGNGTETKAVTIIINKPSQLIALIPALPAGDYHLKIVTQFSGGTDVKEPREVIYPKLLTVA